MDSYIYASCRIANARRHTIAAIAQPTNKLETPRKGGHLRRYNTIWGYLFINPWMIGFLLFGLIPFVASFIFSTYDFQLASPDDTTFIGLANWRRLLFNDPTVWESLGVTLVFALISLPIGFGTAIALAILLNSEELLGQGLFRTLFYAPTMVPGIAATLIWSGVLNPQTGWINQIIESVTTYPAVGVNGIRWLAEPSLVYFAYTFIGLWGIGNTILITLAGLQGVPTELFEAAKIDGASWWRRLWSITLPMITPVLFYNLVLGVIGLLQYFLQPFVLNGGNGFPEGYTRWYMIYFYKQAFTFTNMGYGSALAWFMFIIGLILTLILFMTSKRWVYYAGD